MESYFKQMIMTLLAMSIFNRVNSEVTYEKVTYYLDTTTSAQNLTCQGQTRVYQSAITGTQSVMQFKINTGYGYLRLFYTFELHAPPTFTNDVILYESGQIVYTVKRSLPASTLTNFCSSTSLVQFITFTSSTLMNQQQATLYVQTNSAITLQIKNLNIYAERCQLHCKICEEFTNCLECMPNFTLGQWGRCECESSYLTYYQGQCITSCPANYIFDGDTCSQYNQLINLLYDDTASKFTMYPDYNTTWRECKTTLEGKQVAGLFIQNEIVEYKISNPTATPINIQIEAEFYLFNLQLEQSLFLLLKFNDYIVSQTLIMNNKSNKLSTLRGINQHLCNIVGFHTCLRFTIIQKIDNVLDPQTIQFYINIPLERKEITWAISFINVNAVYLNPITCPLKRFQNQCVDECPITSRTSGNECISIINDYKFSKILWIQNTDNFDIKQKFKIEDPCYLLENLKTMNCKFYQKRYIQGGDLIWRDQQIKFNLKNLSPHYKLKLFLKAILIDPVDNQQSLIVNIDENKYALNKNSPNSYCFSSLVTAGCIIQEDLGTTAADYLINFEQEFDHLNTDLEILFNCNIKSNINSYCAMYDIIILQANCPQNCHYCTSDSVCISSQPQLQVFYDCPSEGYYYSEGACQSCQSVCKTCTNGYYCTTCKDQYVQYGNLCFCKYNFVLATLTDCSEEDCHPSCSKCQRRPNSSYIRAIQKVSQLCASCDRNEHKVLDFDTCECFLGYYMDRASYPSNCKQCSEICKTCSDATTCVTCFPEQNRILQEYQCQCIQGYFENGFDSVCIQCKQTCKHCLYKEEYCTQCYPEQYRQLSTENTCKCQDGYYEDATRENCLKCSDYCNTCSNFQTCTSCNDFQFRILDLHTNQCICQSGYYHIQQLDCLPCYYACSKCNNSDLISQCTACPNSRQKSAHNIETFECKCKKGYFDDGYLECLPCNNLNNPPITHYCYSHCGDQIIQWNEECDDGNLDPRDGCNQCFLQNSNCIDNICLQCQNNKCLQCIDGYYLNNDYACIQCSDECSTCESSQNNCTSCKFDNLSTDKCLSCSQEQGFVQIEGECFSICGDGIRTFQELCDDGNQLIGDGCDQFCNVEDGYICNLQCEKINYLEIQLKEYHLDTIYDSIRTIELKLNQEVKIATNNSIIDFIKITSSTPNLILTVINIKDYSSLKNDYFNIGLDLTIELNSSALSPTIIVAIQNYTLFTNNQGYTFKTNSATIQLIDFIKQDQFVLQNSQNLITMSSYFLYILLGLALLAMIFGGLDIFWNLLDIVGINIQLNFYRDILQKQLSV